MLSDSGKRPYRAPPSYSSGRSSGGRSSSSSSSSNGRGGYGRASNRGSGRGRGRGRGRGDDRGYGRGRGATTQLDANQPVPDRVLTSMLTKSENAAELIRLFQCHGDSFNHVHMSAFWNTMGKHVKRHPQNMRLLQARVRDSPEIFDRARRRTTQLLPSIGARELSNVAHGLASCGLASAGPWVELWDALDETLRARRLAEQSPQGLANTIWAFATAGHASPALYEATSAHIVEQMADFNPQGLANAAWAYATAGEESPVLFAALATELRERDLDEFKSQELCNLLWSFATCGEKVRAAQKPPRSPEARHSQPCVTRPNAFSPDSSELICPVVVPRLLASGLPPACRTTHIWSSAAPLQADELFSLAGPAMASRLHEFSPQGIANALWAYATLGHNNTELFTAAASHTRMRLAQFNQQELSLTAWAYATIGQRSPELFDDLASEAMHRVEELNSQAVSNLAWAYASTGHSAPRFFSTLARKLQDETDDFHPQGLAITTWSLATAEANVSSELLEVVAKCAANSISEFNQQGLSNLVWAFATFNASAPALYDAIANRTRSLVHTFSAQGLSNLLYAFARQMHQADALFESAIPFAVEQAPNMTSQSMIGFFRSFAVLGYDAPSLWRPMALFAHERLDEFTAQGLSNLAWAYAVADVQGPEVDALFGDGAFTGRCNQLIGEERMYSAPGSSAYEHLRQLHQWELWRQATSLAKAADGVPEWPPLDADLTRLCATAFASHHGRPSELQRQVYGVLEELGFDLEEEVMSQIGYSIDIVLNGWREQPSAGEAEEGSLTDQQVAMSTIISGGGADGRRSNAGVASTSIAIEVDGPTHFLYRSSRPSGATRLKRRQLRQSGIRLIPVPYFEWRRCTREALNAEERLEMRKGYLLRKIRQSAMFPE